MQLRTRRKRRVHLLPLQKEEIADRIEDAVEEAKKPNSSSKSSIEKKENVEEVTDAIIEE